MIENDSDVVVFNAWNNITLPKKPVSHLDLWAENTFNRLSNHTNRQHSRQRQLQADIGALMETFDDLTNTYLG